MASDDTDHAVFDVTDTDFDAASPDPSDQADRSSVKDGDAYHSGGCDTLTLRVTPDTPGVANVTTAERDPPSGFASTDNTTVPLPEPDDGLAVTQAASDDTDHDAFDVTGTDIESAEATGTSHLDTPTANWVAGGCVTTIVRVTCGLPVVVTTVTVTLRDDVPLFVSTNNSVAKRLPAPADGLSVSHEASQDADQVVFDATHHPRFQLSQSWGTDTASGRSNDGVTSTGACPTSTVRVTCGKLDVVVTVTVALRNDAVVFGWADKTTAPSPEPVAGLTVNQAALDEADQVTLDVTGTDVDAVNAIHDDTPTSNCGVTAGCATVTEAVAAGLPKVVVNTTVPVRSKPVSLACAVKVAGPSPKYLSGVPVTKPKPDVGVTVTQDGADDTVQAVFDGVLTLVDPPELSGVQV